MESIALGSLSAGTIGGRSCVITKRRRFSFSAHWTLPFPKKLDCRGIPTIGGQAIFRLPLNLGLVRRCQIFFPRYAILWFPRFHSNVPNKAPEPTTGLVTSRAGARIAPSPVVA